MKYNTLQLRNGPENCNNVQIQALFIIVIQHVIYATTCSQRRRVQK